MKTEYPSAVDWWLAGVLIGAPGLIVGLGVIGLEGSVGAGLIQIGVGLAIGGLIAALAYPCVYSITAHGVKIRCGLLTETIPFTAIRDVKKSGSLWSAPALSLKRVKLTLTDGFRLVSPKHRDEFIQAVRLHIQSDNTSR